MRSLYAAALVLLAFAAVAAPAVGERLPDLKAKDVTGEERRLHALLGGRPTLLVAITDRDAADAMQAWFDAADTEAPQANRVSIVSLDLPFFVSDDYARSKAREKVPKAWRSRSLFDSDGKMSEKLKLGGGEKPWAFAVGPDGEVLARVHGGVKSEQASEIWSKLK